MKKWFVIFFAVMASACTTVQPKSVADDPVMLEAQAAGSHSGAAVGMLVNPTVLRGIGGMLVNAFSAVRLFLAINREQQTK